MGWSFMSTVSRSDPVDTECMRLDSVLEGVFFDRPGLVSPE
jgi:hypothetical protein